MSEIAGIIFIFVGIFFITAGTIGLIRFPDFYCRLHALAKVDSLGFGFILLGAAFFFNSFVICIKLFVIWACIILSSATISYIIAEKAYDLKIKPWKKREK